MRGVPVDELPATLDAAGWTEELDAIAATPGQWFKFADVSASTSSYLKKRYRGFDIRTSGYRGGSKGRSRCDMYVRKPA